MKDYCSFSPDGWWGKACMKHDVSYEEIRAMRKVADIKFLGNLKALRVPLVLREIYYYAVRIFGRLAI